jgi:hypothetical protein
MEHGTLSYFSFTKPISFCFFSSPDEPTQLQQLLRPQPLTLLLKIMTELGMSNCQDNDVSRVLELKKLWCQKQTHKRQKTLTRQFLLIKMTQACAHSS